MNEKPYYPPMKPPRDGMDFPPRKPFHRFAGDPPVHKYGGRPPHPPPRGRGGFPYPPPFSPPPGTHPRDGPPPLPLTREDFVEMKHIFVLLIIQSQKDGITGYQLQERYSFPRGSLLRILAELEGNGYLEIKELVEGGRNQKLFSLNDKGIEYLEGLKEKWALQFAMLSEVAPPEKYGFPFHRHRRSRDTPRRIDALETKQEAEDFFRGIRARITGLQNRLKDRLDNVEGMLNRINGIIEAIDKMESLDKPLLKKLFLEYNNLDDKEPDEE